MFICTLLTSMAFAVPVLIDADQDGYLEPEDCNDFDAGVHPGAVDVCDGIDQDCDGVVDDVEGGSAELLHVDADGDGFGDPDQSQVWLCTPAGWVYDGTDCDDDAPAVYPGATEILGDGIDQDCDGADAVDADGDGWAATEDCDDTDATVHPEADDLCDGIDQDCDGVIDDVQGGSALRLYADADGDGYGDPSASEVWLCQPEGFVVDQGDCDDTDADVNPGATEVANDGIDQDCDGQDTTTGGCSTVGAGGLEVLFILPLATSIRRQR